MEVDYVATYHQSNIEMQEFRKLSYTRSEQHKNLTEARMKRDLTD